MPCYHPLKAVRTNTMVDGKQKIVFLKDDADEHLLQKGEQPLLIPCGQCIGCRLEYSRQWAIRCALEASLYEHNYFVTLTYDDEFLPINDVVKYDKETGEFISREIKSTLVKRHLQLFMKRLRKRIKKVYGCTGVRLYGSGEYGSKNGRAHFHVILFNCPLKLEFHHNEDGYTYYTSEDIDKCWVTGEDDPVPGLSMGFHLVSDFSFKTAAYVARYILKKHKGVDSSYYEENGIAPEFSVCSRRPGIGRAYFDSNVDKIYNFDSITIPQLNGSLTCKPPKYYDKIVAERYPEIMEQIKGICSDWMDVENGKVMMCTDLAEDEYRLVCEQNKSLSLKSLVRTL